MRWAAKWLGRRAGRARPAAKLAGDELRGVIDLHSHILPGIDDGAADLGVAVQMARIAVSEGITTMVATPHTLDGVHDVEHGAARRARRQLLDALQAEGLQLDLRVAGEVRLHEKLPALLATTPSISLDGHRHYVLLELPHHEVPDYLPRFLFQLRVAGTTALIAHPERNLAVRRRPEMAAEWVRGGALLQLTAGSLAGTFGPVIRHCAETLLGGGLVHVMATDTHSTHKRPPHVRAAAAAAARLVGTAGARALLIDNPGRILRGAPTAEVKPATPVAGVKVRS